MVRILIGMSGSGKTYRIKEELVHKYTCGVTLNGTCVIERKECDEYSHVFHPDYITVIKSDSDIVDSLLNVKNMDIIIDCEDHSEKFMEKISLIVKRAKRNNNNVTITFLEIWESISLEKSILMQADAVFVGSCAITTEPAVKEMFGIKLRPIMKKGDFREVGKKY